VTIGPADVEAAAARIGGRVRRTPVVEVDGAELRSGHPVVLKLELLQHAGSFKPRGAFNRVLGEAEPPAALVAASGGNHGVAVAHVGRVLSLPAEVFVPELTPPTKLERITALGARLVVGGAVYDDAQAAATARAAETGALLVHPYDHPLVVAGQGTLARELDEQAPEVDTVLVAVGGGGLIAGVAAWFGGRVEVVGVEPERIPALHDGLAAGHPVDVEVSGVAADSLGARRIGDAPWAVASVHVHQVALVTDDAIREAQRWLWAYVRLVTEPGGAAALAALRSGAYRPLHGERLAVVVCGSNTDPSTVLQAD
jgi:threonine dehydratase